MKKLLIKLFVNEFLGRLIKIFKIRWNLFGGRFNYSSVSDLEAAQIFWGIWESAEIRFAKRFVTSGVIIELGSSIGVMLGVLSVHLNNSKFICVEASSKNFDKLKSLEANLPKTNEYVLVNKAVAYGVDKIPFKFTSTTGSRINKKLNDQDSYVSAITLDELLKEHNVNGKYTLITDIEGAEDAIFFNDENALRDCSMIIAELEMTPNHTIEEQIQQLQRIGFILIERYDCVVVMSRI